MTINKFKQFINSIWKSIPVLTLAVFIQVSLPKMSLAIVNPPALEMENFSADEQFDKDFREARDLIDREEWAKAAEKFNQVISKYPNNKSTDAALYWLAFCYKKQKQYKETDAALARLLKDFPDSSWSDDARVMQAEISFSLGKVYVAGTTYPINQLNSKYAVEFNKSIAKGTVATTVPGQIQNKELIELYNSDFKRTPLDREDEIKIAAFQSLLSADQKRAIEAMGDILRTDSKASETLKQEVLRVLRSPRLLRNETSYSLFSSGIKKEFIPLLKETLMKSFQNESNVKIRKEIIYALANINDDQSIEYLAQLYASEKNQEIKKAIINSFSSSPTYLYGSQNLFKAYTPSTASTAADSVNPSRKLEFDKLMEIVRTEKDIELRRLAFTNLQRFAGWSTNEQTADMLIGLYDSQTDEEFKISIIRSFGTLKQNQASRKLLEIAKNDKSDKLKLEAIYALRTSNNPEALKFLEELIK